MQSAVVRLAKGHDGHKLQKVSRPLSRVPTPNVATPANVSALTALSAQEWCCPDRRVERPAQSGRTTAREADD